MGGHALTQEFPLILNPALQELSLYLVPPLEQSELITLQLEQLPFAGQELKV